MLRDSSDTLDLVGVLTGDIEGLNTAEILNVPKFDHTLGVSCDEAIQVWQAIDSDEWVLVAI